MSRVQQLRIAEPAGGQCRCADADAGAHYRRPRVERDGVAVDRDADLVEAVLTLLAVEVGVAQVDRRRATGPQSSSAPPFVAGVTRQRDLPLVLGQDSVRHPARVQMDATLCPGRFWVCTVARIARGTD